ncbi:MAG: ATP phosphoribosyltransferase [Gemmatimonadaceae bacterium]|nr:ATP phosphoribosyltransferase [Gemmatimonadaceae bacterium]MCW5827020.1 ATP phosphoribosyltransferase [Gemmatimonadaceae bacterium]
MLRLAIPNKGRLHDDARSLLADAGLEVRASSERALVASLGGEFEAIFVRAQDIPEFVADGAADAGITGRDLVAESGRPLESRLDLGFGRCRVVVAAKDDGSTRRVGDIPDGARVASVFPRLTERFFSELGKRVQLVPVSGAVEIAPHLGIADVIVDLTSTGSTLRVNGLRELGTVLESTAHLVVPSAANGRAPNGERDVALRELVDALASVLAARGQRYLMANVPRSRLDDVRRLLPGISGPTVIDVMNGGSKVAVHAVCPAAGIYRTINALKAIGGEGILVTRIERLLP